MPPCSWSEAAICVICRRELTADQIAVLLAKPPFARIVFTPAISFAIDRAGGRRPQRA
jgi:hypothetical protein